MVYSIKHEFFSTFNRSRLLIVNGNDNILQPFFLNGELEAAK